ncbi:MAG: copper resistance CopC family protein [Pseudomonadota bacterium]
MKRITVICVTLLFCLSTTAPVSAHSLLQQSRPADGDAVVAPEQLYLQFNEPVRLLRVTLTGPDQAGIPFGFQPNRESSASLAFDLPPLGGGEYRVEWTLIGQDGHTVSEEFVFTVESDRS